MIGRSTRIIRHTKLHRRLASGRCSEGEHQGLWCHGIMGRIVVRKRAKIGGMVNEPRRCGHGNNEHDP